MGSQITKQLAILFQTAARLLTVGVRGLALVASQMSDARTASARAVQRRNAPFFSRPQPVWLMLGWRSCLGACVEDLLGRTHPLSFILAKCSR